MLAVCVEDVEGIATRAGLDQAPSLKALDRAGLRESAVADDPVSLLAKLTPESDSLGTFGALAEIETLDVLCNTEEIGDTNLAFTELREPHVNELSPGVSFEV